MTARISSRPLLLVLALAALALAPALGAEAPAGEAALHRDRTDAALAWGPCPPFLPAGCRLAVLHGDPAQPNVDVFLELPAGAEIPLHWHTSAERMVLVAGRLEVTYDGQEPFTMVAGSYAYGPAKRPHRATCSSAEPCLLFVAFEAPLDAVAVEPRE